MARIRAGHATLHQTACCTPIGRSLLAPWRSACWRFKASRIHGGLFLRGHSAGSYAGMVWETILAEFPNIAGRTVPAAIALPPSLLTRSTLSYNRQVHLIHHADDLSHAWSREAAPWALRPIQLSSQISPHGADPAAQARQLSRAHGCTYMASLLKVLPAGRMLSCQGHLLPLWKLISCQFKTASSGVSIR